MAMMIHNYLKLPNIDKKKVCGIKFPNPYGLASAPPATTCAMIRFFSPIYSSKTSQFVKDLCHREFMTLYLIFDRLAGKKVKMNSICFLLLHLYGVLDTVSYTVYNSYFIWLLIDDYRGTKVQIMSNNFSFQLFGAIDWNAFCHPTRRQETFGQIKIKFYFCFIRPRKRKFCVCSIFFPIFQKNSD